MPDLNLEFDVPFRCAGVREWARLVRGVAGEAVCQASRPCRVHSAELPVAQASQQPALHLPPARMPPPLPHATRSPRRELAFEGVPHRSTVTVMPTVNCIVELTEMPFTVGGP